MVQKWVVVVGLVTGLAIVTGAGIDTGVASGQARAPQPAKPEAVPAATEGSLRITTESGEELTPEAAIQMLQAQLAMVTAERDMLRKQVEQLKTQLASAEQASAAPAGQPAPEAPVSTGRARIEGTVVSVFKGSDPAKAEEIAQQETVVADLEKLITQLARYDSANVTDRSKRLEKTRAENDLRRERGVLLRLQREQGDSANTRSLTVSLGDNSLLRISTANPALNQTIDSLKPGSAVAAVGRLSTVRGERVLFADSVVVQQPSASPSAPPAAP